MATSWLHTFVRGGVAGMLLALIAVPDVASADNCSSLSDCFATLRNLNDAIWGFILGGGGLTLGRFLFEFTPAGLPGSIYEAVTGRELFTGRELEPWERTLTLLPGGVLFSYAAVRGGRHLLGAGKHARTTGRVASPTPAAPLGPAPRASGPPATSVPSPMGAPRAAPLPATPLPPVPPHPAPFRPPPTPTTPPTVPLPPVSRWLNKIKDVNAGAKGHPGRNVNCQRCTDAVEKILKGADPATVRALPLPPLPGQLEKRIAEVTKGKTPMPPGAVQPGTFFKVTGFKQAADVLEGLGPGQTARIWGRRPPNAKGEAVPGHIWNGYNDMGRPIFLDGQTGTWANWNAGYNEYWMVLT